MSQSTFNFKKSIVYVSVLTISALALSGWVGQSLMKKEILTAQSAFLLQAFIMSGIILPGIWIVRKYVDRLHSMDLGISKKSSPILLFLLGSAMVVLPIFTALTISSLMDWTSITLNLHSGAIIPIAIGLVTVLLFEAIPEELVFRGYIYGALRTTLGKWASAITSVLLFILLPVILVPIQKYVLGMDIMIGGADFVSASYLIVMLFFGSFMMYLRIVSGSVWMTIGFHAMFVFIDRMIGLSNTSLIQITEETNQTAVQITLMSCYLVMILLFITRIILNRRKINNSAELANS